jgi:MFS family permease
MAEAAAGVRAGAVPSGHVATRHVPASHVAAVSIGNALEFYDFLTFSLFAVYIGEAFFPGHDATDKLYASLATFWVGFLTRPLGAAVLGPLGDKIGRKPAMLISFGLIGLGMLGLAVTPTYKSIGPAAPVLVVIFRLIQGFALGGNVGPTTAFMLEAAPPLRRGFYTSFQGASQAVAILASAVVGWTMARLLGPADLGAWGWRVAFALGVTIVPFGLWLRGRLPETHAAPVAGLRTPLRPHLRLMGCAFFLLLAATIVTYIALYMTTYALDTLHQGPSVAFAVSIVISVAMLVSSLGSGWISDRIGRRPVALVSGLAGAALSAPIFLVIHATASPLMLFAGMAVLGALVGLTGAQAILILAEGLPPAIRSGGMAIVYALAISIFGGATQLVLAKAIHSSNSPLTPALFLIGAFVIGLAAALLAPETAPVKTGRA